MSTMPNQAKPEPLPYIIYPEAPSPYCKLISGSPYIHCSQGLEQPERVVVNDVVHIDDDIDDDIESLDFVVLD
jgi:hypothetical protein